MECQKLGVSDSCWALPLIRIGKIQIVTNALVQSQYLFTRFSCSLCLGYDFHGLLCIADEASNVDTWEPRTQKIIRDRHTCTSCAAEN